VEVLRKELGEISKNNKDLTDRIVRLETLFKNEKK
jgi:hypothetical protein